MRIGGKKRKKENIPGNSYFKMIRVVLSRWRDYKHLVSHCAFVHVSKFLTQSVSS